MSPNKTPLVSVIIPTYKRSDSLLRTIDSVLKQTYPNIEIIVVDDNGIGTEFQRKTQEKLQPLIDAGSIIYIPHEVNKNGSAARNTGFHASHGEYVNFMDDDDIMMPEKIRKQVERLEGTEEKVGACYCNTKCLTPPGRKDVVTNYSKHGNLIRDILLSEMICNTSAIMFKRNALEKINAFDESFQRLQDFELLVRYFRYYIFVCCEGQYQLILDWSEERINVPDFYKMEKIESHFFKTYEKDLKEHGVSNELHHHWDIVHVLKCIDSENYSLAMKYYKIAKNNNRIFLKDYMKIFKKMVKKCLLKK